MARFLLRPAEAGYTVYGGGDLRSHDATEERMTPLDTRPDFTCELPPPTTPLGRDPAEHGYPLRICELLATLDAPVFLERVALGSNKQIMATGRAIRRALDFSTVAA